MSRSLLLLLTVLLLGVLSGCQGSPRPNITPETVSQAITPAAALAGTRATSATVAGPVVSAATPAPLRELSATAPALLTLTSSPAPSATPTPSPTLTPTPTPTPTASPTPSPAPAPQARRLTDGGCCADPFFLDGKVAFIDRPDANRPAGFYAIPPDGGAPALVEQRIGVFLNEGAFFSYLDGNITIIERRSDGQQWRIDTQRQPIGLSPDGQFATWSVREWEGAFDRRRTQIYWAPLAGGPSRLIASLFGGGLTAWLPGDRWLLSGRRDVAESDRALFVFELNGGRTTELLRALNIRSASVSPDGRWVLIALAQEREAERNGLWLLRTDGSERRKLDWFGAFAWRDAGHILYFPYGERAASHQVWLYDVDASRSRQLITDDITPFKIAQGEFALAPDGRSLAFVSATDFNIWLLPLPAE